MSDGIRNGDPVGVRLDRIEARLDGIERLLARLARLIEQAGDAVRTEEE